jgi:hypothetical protein
MAPLGKPSEDINRHVEILACICLYSQLVLIVDVAIVVDRGRKTRCRQGEYGKACDGYGKPPEMLKLERDAAF